MVLCWGGFLGSLANSLGELRWCMWHTACFNMVLTSTASISVPSVAPRDCACPCGLYLLPSIAAELLVLALAPALWVAAAAVLMIIPHTNIWVSGSALASAVIAYCRGLFSAARAGAALFVGRRIPAVPPWGFGARVSQAAALLQEGGSGAALPPRGDGPGASVPGLVPSAGPPLLGGGVLPWSRTRGPAEFWDPSHPCLEHV